MKLNAYLDEWLSRIGPRLAPRTVEGYAQRLRLYVRPYLGEYDLEDLTTMAVDEGYGRARERGVSQACLYLGHQVLGRALRRAVIWRLILENPAEDVRISAPPARLPPVLAPGQVPTFLQALPSDQWGALFITGLGTGLRPGELFGLQWGDVSWMSPAAVQVQRTIYRTMVGRGWEPRPPKTARGRRIVLLPGPVVEALQEHGARNNQRRQGSDFVFLGSDGCPVDDRMARKRLATICDHAGLPRMSLYSLRHSFASLSIDAGVEIVDLAAIMGHASVTTTLNTYVRRRPEHRVAARDRFSRLVWGN